MPPSVRRLVTRSFEKTWILVILGMTRKRIGHDSSGCYFRYQRGRLSPFRASTRHRTGGDFGQTHAHLRMLRTATHATQHTHGTCTLKGNGQQIIVGPQHTTPKTHSPSPPLTHPFLAFVPHAHLRMSSPRPTCTTQPYHRQSLANGLRACVVRTSPRSSEETYGKLHWGSWSGENI